MNHEPPFEITEPGVVVDKHGLIALKFDNDYRGVVEGLVSTANSQEVIKKILEFVKVISWPQGCISGHYSMQAEKLLEEYNQSLTTE